MNSYSPWLHAASNLTLYSETYRALRRTALRDEMNNTSSYCIRRVRYISVCGVRALRTTPRMYCLYVLNVFAFKFQLRYIMAYVTVLELNFAKPS